MPLVNKIIQVSCVQFYSTSSVQCIGVHHPKSSLRPAPFIPSVPCSTSLQLPFPSTLSHSCLCPWVFFYFFLFAQSLHTPHSEFLLTAVSLLSIYKSVTILLFSSVSSLDSTHQWNYVVLVFLSLAYFT